MFERMTAAAAMVAIVLMASASAAPDLSAQRGEMPGQPPDSMPGMMGDRMMMGGMMGQGMMDSGMMQMMGRGMGMMATGGPGPTMILQMGASLGLTDEQVARLEEIRDDFAGTRQEQMHAAMASHQEAQKALEGDSPDFGTYAEALYEASDRMVEAHVTMARAAFQARSILTEEQREKLHSGMGMMQEMMEQAPGGQGDRGMPHGGGGNMPHGGGAPR